jgi:hypothetical protein
MRFIISKMPPIITIEDNKKLIKNGYAFIDENGYCIIIVYGDNNKDLMSKYLK